LSNAIYGNSSKFSDDVITIPPNGAQDLHENLLSIGDAAFPGLSNQNELNWTEHERNAIMQHQPVLHLVRLPVEPPLCVTRPSPSWVGSGHETTSYLACPQALC